MPERLSLNLDFEKIKNTPYFTNFFLLKYMDLLNIFLQIIMDL